MIMWFTELAFDPVRDISPVDQFGFVDLKSALANSAVPSVMPGADLDYNGVDDPSAIIGKPRDVFEVIDMQRDLEAAASAAEASANSDAKAGE